MFSGSTTLRRLGGFKRFLLSLLYSVEKLNLIKIASTTTVGFELVFEPRRGLGGCDMRPPVHSRFVEGSELLGLLCSG